MRKVIKTILISIASIAAVIALIIGSVVLAF